MCDWFATHRETARLVVCELITGGPTLGGTGAVSVQQVLQTTVAFLSEHGRLPPRRPQAARAVHRRLHLLTFAAPEATEAFPEGALASPAPRRAVTGGRRRPGS